MRDGTPRTDGKAEAVPSLADISSTEANTPAEVLAFTEDLVAAHDGRLRSLPDFGASLSHDGTLQSDVERYRRMSGVYLTDEAIERAGGARIPHVSFEHKSRWRLGREDSRRQVFFGNLHIGGDGETLPVAVKPFKPTAFHYATHEIGMFQYMHERGLPTLSMLGMVAVSEGEGKVPRAYTLTREMHGINTLDNTVWNELAPNERWQRLRPAIDTLVTLHTHMLFHGDLEFKNVAYGETDRTAEDPSICIVDPEEAVSLRNVVAEYEDIPEQRQQVLRKMSADFASLENSIRGRIADRNTKEIERFEDVLDYVYSPYYLAILRSDSPYVAVLQGAFEMMLERKRKQAYGEWTGR